MDEKKPSTSTSAIPSSSTQPAATPPPNSSPPKKGPLISRRRFLQGVVAASTVLADASVGASGQILGPLIPTSATTQEIIVFFFQAEDGIRDYKVTGVQTCALPISASARDPRAGRRSHRACAAAALPPHA